MKRFLLAIIAVLACNGLAGCIAATAVSVAGDVVQGTVDVAGNVGQAVIPGDDEDDEDDD